jgi:hypothetical protein
MAELFNEKWQVAPLHLSPIVTITGRSQMRASFAQQRVWSKELTSSGPSNICLSLVIKKGMMSIKRIRSAIRATIERHEILRTAVYYNEESDQLEQKVQNVYDDNNYLFQWTHTVQPLEKSDALIAVDSTTDFANIDCGLVFRCHLINTNKAELEHLYTGDLLIFTFHRIAFDMKSIDPFFQTFVQAYDGAKFSSIIPQYIDFTAYEYDQSIDLDPHSKMNRARRFWSMIMDGYDINNNDVLHQVFDIKRKPRSGFIHSIVFVLNSNIVNAQMQFASSNNLTIFQVNLACYFLFLSKLSNCKTNDLCVTCSLDSRILEEMRVMVGMFANLLPFRIMIEPTASFLDFVKKVQILCIEVFEHAHLPYQQIVGVDSNAFLPKIPFHFDYQSRATSESIMEIKTKDATLNIHTDRDWSHDNADYDNKLCLIRKHDYQVNAIRCTLLCSADCYDEAAMVTLSQCFQDLLLQLFPSVTTAEFDEALKPISKLSLFRTTNTFEMQQTNINDQTTVANTGMCFSLFRDGC